MADGLEGVEDKGCCGAQLFEQTLGLHSPSRVKEVELDMKGQKVVVIVEVTAGTHWGEGGQQLPVHGWKEREWRHLDTMQFETIIHYSCAGAAGSAAKIRR